VHFNIVSTHFVTVLIGWIRLQNGYYLPITSDDGKVTFLKQVSTEVRSSNLEKKSLGSTTPMFRTSMETLDNPNGSSNLSALLQDKLTLGPSMTSKKCNKSLDVLKEEDTIDVVENEIGKRPCIHMDAMAFGMGCCCLQITFQAKDIEESRFIYDQLAVVAPIMMALTASTPILKGRLADTDCRWGVISESVDDRTLAERGRTTNEDCSDPELAGKGVRRIFKSRYDCISTYIYQGSNKDGVGMENRVLNMYNDIPVPIDEAYYMQLRDSGVDPALSQHIAHLFIRDPLVIFDGAVEELDDETQTEHFESIQSTNWQTVRWKPPPPRNNPNDPHIGWRTEFRSMEMQMTDFENAAFSVFIVLLTRTILTFDLNLYIPISRVDTNMQRAHSRNASAKGKYFFRRHMAPLEEGDDGYGVKYTSMFARVASTSALSEELEDDEGPSSTTNSSGGSSVTSMPSNHNAVELDENGTSIKRKKAPVARGSSDEENSFEEMTMKEIMTGKGDYFPGLIPLVRAYLDHINADDVAHAQISKYLDFIELRSKGELVTPATWMRNFVRNHPAYKNDSHVSQEIAYDLMMACKDIGEGKRHEKSLLGDFKISPVSTKGAYDGGVLGGESVGNDDLLKLLRRYSKRKAFNRTKKSPEQSTGSGNDKVMDTEMDTHSLIK
jgi:glutamate--cysteine ligase catalytic subunit